MDRNDTNNLGPKGQLSKTILTLRRDASTWKAIYGMHRCSEQTNHEHIKKKEKLIVMSCTWKIRSGLNKNQESKKKCWKNDENCIHTNHFFLLQGITLQFRWLCLKWEMAIFHHSFTNVENYPIVSPLSLIISFKYPDQGSPPTLGGKGKRYSLKDCKWLNAWCWKANLRN